MAVQDGWRNRIKRNRIFWYSLCALFSFAKSYISLIIEYRCIGYSTQTDVHELKEILKDTDDVVEITKEDLENKKRHYLETKLYQCVRYMRNDLWPTWNYYLKKFLANGGMIEAAAPDNMDSPLREYPVFHGMIEPGLKLRFLSTSTQVIFNSQFITTTFNEPNRRCFQAQISLGLAYFLRTQSAMTRLYPLQTLF